MIPCSRIPSYKSMTVAQFKAHRKTERGAEEWCMLHDFDPYKCADEIKILAERSMQECKQKWEEAVNHCGGDTIENLYKAEIWMGSMGYYPPHYEYEARCKVCGPVLTPYPNEKVIDECILCKSGYTAEIDEVIEEITLERVRNG